MLNKSKGNMYEFVTHTWNTVKGACGHDCSYCYMKRWGKLNPARFDEKELKTDLGSGNFIFVGSSNDMFADDVPSEWIKKTLDHCKSFYNRYLLQTKNPKRFHEFGLDNRFILGTTIESNRDYPEVYNNSPSPVERASELSKVVCDKFITIEPILDFDLDIFVELINTVKPKWVNIGADSGNNKLPEPSKEKISLLIESLGFYDLEIKKNMKRLK